MKFDIYCDECFPDLLTSSNPKADFVIIGSLWIPTECRTQFKSSVHRLRDTYNVGGEIKSRKVSPSRLDFYKNLINLYIESDKMRFRAIAIEASKVDVKKYHKGSSERSFYIFYYQMLHHWIRAHNTYSIFCDYQTNQNPDQLQNLQAVMTKVHPLSNFQTVQWVRSKESVLTQLTDVLTGLVSARLNKTPKKGSAKEALLLHLENKLDQTICPTSREVQKFNLFKINLNGGW